MMIEDEELRLLYKTSSSEHIQKLESDLMILEKNPQDTEALAEFLREAHTLKGDSRMLGLDDIEMLVHHLEDCMEGIKAGKEEITPEFCDRLYQGIDAINQLSSRAITGKAVEVDTFEVLASLMGAAASSADNQSEADLFDDQPSSIGSEADLFGDDDDIFDSSSNSIDSESSLFDDDDEDDFFNSQDDVKNSELLFFEDDLPAAESEAVPEKPIGTLAPGVSKPETIASTAYRDYKIDTIRVEPQKLDTLMTQASELAVTKLRISQQMSDIEQIIGLWSGWQKQDQKIITEIEQSLPPELMHPLQQFLQTTEQQVDSLGSLINNLKTRASEDVASLEIISDRLESGINGLRQLPLSTVFNIYPRMVRDLARQLDKNIELVIQGGDTKADKRILEEIKDPLLHLIRNAIDHGIETPEERIQAGKSPTATLTLRGYQTGNSIGIDISDDGRGLDVVSISNTAMQRKVRTEDELAAMSESEIQSLIFASGFSTRSEITELSGRGVGLDVVRSNVEKLKGSIEVSSVTGNGCKFQVRLNTSLATTKVLIIEVNDTLYAIPLEFILTMISVSPPEIYDIEGKDTVTFDNEPLSVNYLSSLLQLPVPEGAYLQHSSMSCIVLQVAGDRFGIFVDDLVDQQDVVLKPQSKLLKRIPNIAGATILGSGEVCMILNPSDLLHSLKSGNWQQIPQINETTTVKNRLLLVEDSIIIRTQMQRLLKNAGYNVTTADNGLAGLQLVQTQEFDIVLSDVEMPQMTGLEMTAKIRQDQKYDNLPIILITTLTSPEDKLRGREVGANAYLTKGDFEQQLLFDTLSQLIYSHN